jgi:FkbM family methyltransferase
MSRMGRFFREALKSAGVEIKWYIEPKNPLCFLPKYDIQTVINVGANTGTRTQELRRTLPSAYIHSFEPVQECFDKLLRTMKGDVRFTAYHMALGETSGEVVVHKCSYSPSSSLLKSTEFFESAYPFIRGHTDEKTVMKTLDSALAGKELKNNVLLQVDVQGYERQVLSGATQVLSQTLMVMIENSFSELYEGQALFPEIYEMLKVRGFRYSGNIHHTRHPETRESLYEQSIFIRST